jgi:LysR family transcriptional regulator, low CO2-responsive transcriptional regulator
MELRQLRSFHAAATLTSMSKAAETLQIRQPTVTNHIKQLERELGVTLFDRELRPIQPTHAGETLFRLVGPLLDGVANLKADTVSSEEATPLVIASVQDAIPYALLRVLRHMRGRFSHFHVNVQSGSFETVVRLVARREAEVGVVVNKVIGDEFNFVPMFQYDRVLIAPLGHPVLDDGALTLEQIARWPLVMMQQSRTRELLEAEFQRDGVPFDIVMEIDSMYMIKRYVEAGIGISVGPGSALEPQDEAHLGHVSLKSILPDDSGGIFTLKDRVLSRSAQRFIDSFGETFTAERGRPENTGSE